jgi:hypothetical protein
VRHGGSHPADNIESEVAPVPKPVLDRRSEQPQRPHVEYEMQPPTVQEHHREERKKVGNRKICTMPN